MDRKKLFRRNSLFVLFLFVCMVLVPLVFADGIYAATPQISGGNYHTVVLNNDGTLWGWGRNDYGQLGLGNTAQQNSPVQIGTDTDWVSVSAGAFHTAAVNADGIVYAWGFNSQGQLGDGTTTDSHIPKQVSLPATSVAVASGYNFTVALMADGTVFAWGYNGFGQLGNGSTSPSLTPVQVLADPPSTALQNIGQVAAGGEHVVALSITGVVYAWGRNSSGAIGDGSVGNKLIPTIPLGLPVNQINHVAAGAHFSLALTNNVSSNGSLYAWGSNWQGQLGLGDTVDRYTPVLVTTGVANVVGGGDHTVALKTDGTLWSWGRNDAYQLGRNSDVTCANLNCSTTPGQIGSDSDWSHISSRGYHTVAVKNSGDVWTAGNNNYGQLGRDETFSCSFQNPETGITSSVDCSEFPGRIMHTITAAVVDTDPSCGNLFPTGQVLVYYNVFSNTRDFDVSPSTGCFARVDSNCPGAFYYESDYFITVPITHDCTVTATFAPCNYLINPETFAFTPFGGFSTYAVTRVDSSCDWVAKLDVEWITLGTYIPYSNTGSFTVAPNPSTGSRTATVSLYDGESDLGKSFTINQDGCTFAINPYKAVLPASGGEFTVSVISSYPVCEWMQAALQSNDTWLQITSLGAGPDPGSGIVTYFAGANAGAKRTGTITIAGRTFTVEQLDNKYLETLELTNPTVAAGDPMWVTAKFTNNTMEPIVTIRPNCCNTYFWMTDSLGNMVMPRDRICAPTMLPEDIVTVQAGEVIEYLCDLSEVYRPEVLPVGTVDILATYVNTISGVPATGDPLTEPDEPYVLWTGAAVSGKTQVTITGGARTLDNIKTAVVSYNPSAWNPQWATTGGSPIIAQISNIDGHSVNDVDVSTIRLNGTVPIIAGSNSIANGILTVQFNRAQAVASLGNLGVSPPATVTPKVQGNVGSEVFAAMAPVGIAGNAEFSAYKHIVGAGPKPTVNKEPLPSLRIRVYDKSNGSCAASLGISWQRYPDIWHACAYAAETFTTMEGKAIFSLPSGNYLAIGRFIIPATSTTPTAYLYIGNSVGSVDAYSMTKKQLQVLQTSGPNGQIVPAVYRVLTGSELLVIEPEYIEWNGTEELYPFVFESVGDWGVTTEVTPPEGFVADNPALSDQVNTELKALQFTIVDVGSKWVLTKAHHKIKHKGKTVHLDSKVGMKLSRGLQKKLGFGEFGEKED